MTEAPLDSEKIILKSNINNDLKDPKFWASVCAWGVPISIILLWLLGIFKCWSISEIGSIIAAIAGPLAGLAGFLYIYASFQIQNATLTQQQIQIQNQEKYFFENSFQNLLINYRQIIDFKKIEKSGKKLSELFDSLYYRNITLPNGDNLQEKITDDRKKSKNAYNEVSFRLEIEDRENILLGLRQLLHVLNFIKDELNSESHYHETIFRYLSSMEIFCYFYFYVIFEVDHTQRENRLLFEFFRKVTGEDLHKSWHIEWVIDPDLKRG